MNLSTLISHLTIRPYAVGTFYDIDRRKPFTTLFYRRKKAGPLEGQLAFLAAVLADIPAAGLTIRPGVKVGLSPDAGGFTLHLEIPIGKGGPD